jgi:UDP-N-acetyl-D-glucosamine dehydrogenase
MRVGVIGLGYVGQTIARAAAASGHVVVGYDINAESVKKLEAKEISNFIGTTDETKLSECEIVLIAVPTPLTEDRKPDLSFVHQASDLIARNFKSSILVINESTSHPGTLRIEIAERIAKASGVVHLYASSPERVDPGNANWLVKNTPRLLSGLTPEAIALAKSFYSLFCDTIIETSTPEVAEAAKLFENTFRQVNIALVNEFAQIAHALQIDPREVISAASTKPYGFMEFTPGAGVGGHCIPVDPIYLSNVAAKAGVPATFIERATQVNQAMPAYVVSRVIAAAGGSIKGKKVVVVGVAYKPDVTDTRETPSAEIIRLLTSAGATVTWNDHVVGTWMGQSSSPIEGSDIAVIVTRHSGLTEAEIKKATYVFDCTGTVKGVDRV